MEQDELYHYGVKGMKWGVRKSPISAKLKTYRDKSKDPKTDFLNMNRPNSAARTYYRSQKTEDFKEYQKQTRILNEKVSGLSKDQIENGRYRVARARNIKRKTVSALMGAGAGALAVGTAGVGAAGVAAVVGIGANFVTGGHYYQHQSATYGRRRAEREIKSER